MQEIRVMIVDDMPQILEYYKLIVERERGFRVAATAASGREAVEKALQVKPDVILMDIQMETGDAGIEATRQIIGRLPGMKVIMLTAHNDSDTIASAFVAGASDYLTTGSSLVEIVNTIRECAENSAGKTHINKAMATELVRMSRERESLLFVINLVSRLSRAEIEVLKLACDGKTYRQIARERGVEEVTIRTTANKIKNKTGIRSMKELVEKLRDLDILNALELFQ